jgi:non-ribosomal peptide synthase protein (TIGR01720 family)
VLDVSEVLPSDNFSQLGGDSTAAMRLLLDADSIGLGLQMSQVRLARNMEELARDAAVVRRPETASSGSGPIALGPTPRWFLDWAGHPPPRWNLLTAVTSHGPLDAAALAAAALAASSRHDAFRLRLDRRSDAWRSHLQDEPRTAVEQMALADVPVGQRHDALAAAADVLQTTVGLMDGPLARILHVDRGARTGAVVMLCASHLVSDAYSQAVLLQDIEVAYEQLAAGEPLALPPPTATMRAWTDALARLARSAELDAERAHWLRTLGGSAGSVPLDFPGGHNSSDSVTCCAVGLSRERTQRLFVASHRSERRGTLTLLLTAIALACARWTGGAELAFRLLTHGRDRGVLGLDLRRTVACASHAFPVRLSLPVRDDASEMTGAVIGALAGVPRRGIGYTLLRHVREDQELARLPEPDLSINFRGRLAPAGRSLLRTRLPSLSGVRLSPGAPRSMVLEVDIVVEDGALLTRWLYSGNLHRHDSIAEVAATYLATLNGLIDRDS